MIVHILDLYFKGFLPFLISHLLTANWLLCCFWPWLGHKLLYHMIQLIFRHRYFLRPVFEVSSDFFLFSCLYHSFSLQIGLCFILFLIKRSSPPLLNYLPPKPPVSKYALKSLNFAHSVSNKSISFWESFWVLCTYVLHVPLDRIFELYSGLLVRW